MSKVSIPNVKEVDRAIEGHVANIGRVGAKREVSMVSNVSGQQKCHIDRIGTEKQVSMLSEAYSKNAKFRVLNDILSNFEKYVSDSGYIDPANDKILPNTHNIEFLSEEMMLSYNKMLSNDSIASGKEKFVNNCVKLSNEINEFASKIDSSFSDCKDLLKNQLREVNSIVEELCKNNKSMQRAKGEELFKLLDNRDDAVSRLANIIDFELKTDSKGCVQITLGNAEIVSKNSFAQFKLSDKSPLHLGIRDVIKSDAKFEIDVVSSTGGDIGKITSSDFGVIGGAMEALNECLPSYLKKVDDCAKNTAKIMNYMHSFATSESGKHTFKSEVETNNSAVLADMSKTTITAVDKSGKSISSADTKVLAYEFDFSGKKVKDVIKEINNKLCYGTSQKAIKDIGNVRLVNTSKNGNVFKFKLEFENQRGIGTKFMIGGIAKDDNGGGGMGVGGITNDSNAIYDLKAGEFTQSDEITIDFGAQNAGSKIRLNLVAIGDDNTVTPFQVEYTVDMNGNPKDIYYLDSARAKNFAPADGDDVIVQYTGANITANQAFGNLLSAKLIDESGNEIPENSDRTGKILIQSRDDTNVVMYDHFENTNKNGLTSMFEMNNLFDYDSKTSRIKVKEEIQKNSGLISTSSISYFQEDEKQVKQGIADRIKLDFTLIGLMGMPLGIRNGDTFGINVFGKNFEFIFRNVPVDPKTDVGIDADPRVTIQALVDKLKNDADLSKLLNFEYDNTAVPPSLTVTSKVKGNHADNKVEFTWNFVGAGLNSVVVEAFDAGGGTIRVASAIVNLGNNVSMRDGDVTTILKKYPSTKFSLYSVDPNVLGKLTNIAKRDFITENAFGDKVGINLADFTRDTCFAITNQIDDVATQHEVSVHEVKEMRSYYASISGADPQEEKSSIVDMLNYKRMMVHISKLMMDSNKEMISIIMGR